MHIGLDFEVVPGKLGERKAKAETAFVHPRLHGLAGATGIRVRALAVGRHAIQGL
jgi:hypothetical protein